MWVQSLGWEDLLEKEMATHCSILAWKIPWTEEPGGHNPYGLKESDTSGRLSIQGKQIHTRPSFGSAILVIHLNTCSFHS